MYSGRQQKRFLQDYLKDILHDIQRLEHFGEVDLDNMHGLSLYDLSDHKALYFYGACKAIENIGETVNKIPQDIKNQYPEIPWKEIAGMRNILVHEYFGIKLDRVCHTIKNDLGPLKTVVLKILGSANAQPELFLASKDKERFAELVEAVKDADFRFVRMKLMLIKQNEGAEYLVNFMKQKTPENMTLVQLAKRGKFEDPDVERQEVLGKMVDLLERVAESGEIKTDAASSEVSQHADTSVDGTLDPSGKL